MSTLADAYQLMHEGTLALSQVEANGIHIDPDKLDHSIDKMERKIKRLRSELLDDPVYDKWRRRYGNRTKLGNRQQLATVLYQDFGQTWKGGETKRGYKTDEASFDHIKLPFVKSYIQLEKFRKIRSTYLLGLKRESLGALVHAIYNLHLALSYRSSCDTPNLQNVPIRVELAKKIIRECIIAPDGFDILEADFKGIEVGVAACYCKDPNLISYVEDSSRDMHRDTAMELFELQKNQVSKLARHIAKNKFVFPQFYGDFYASCARNIWEELDRLKVNLEGSDQSLLDHLKEHGIKKLGACDPEVKPKKHSFELRVKEIEDSFWNDRFPVYHKWRQDTWIAYQKTGRLEFLTGFIARGSYRRNQVRNLQIQGSAFHCLLWCLIQLQKWLVRKGMRTRIIMQIHDSMVLYVWKPELQRVLRKLRKIMSEDLPKHWRWIIVPLVVEIEMAASGQSWYDKKPIDHA